MLPPTSAPSSTVRRAITNGSRSTPTPEKINAVPTAAPISFASPHPSRSSPSSIPVNPSASTVSRLASTPAPFSPPSITRNLSDAVRPPRMIPIPAPTTNAAPGIIIIRRGMFNRMAFLLRSSSMSPAIDTVS
ncbi:unnamed protein product [Cyclocybe aegerita]|uniref:Uncharacterized protein n=1 Tax=Cyclocybe aegerita TaxID=1973307 RepID=A0A8S0W7H1_CYCAE|nr:unnamed protein product [Cyclocybe aegerita]